MGRQRVTRFGEGQVFPHEETLPAAKVDRLMLTVVTKANLSPIFGLYPDPECEAQNLLDAATPTRRRWWLPITWAWSIASGR